jgi:pyrroloquinoline quinone (PQQ) biosynthesis protein C
VSLESHPFVQRWLEGELTANELQTFAAEHYHAVTALERAARSAARLSDGLLADQLRRYADEQADAIGLLCRFASATGWGQAWYFAEDPLPETVACAHALSGAGDARSLELHLVTIYTLESALAEVVPLQLATLIAAYGFDDTALAYFESRALRSADDALTAEAALTSLLPESSPAALLDHAEAMYASYAALLDGVNRMWSPTGPSSSTLRSRR